MDEEALQLKVRGYKTDLRQARNTFYESETNMPGDLLKGVDPLIPNLKYDEIVNVCDQVKSQFKTGMIFQHLLYSKFNKYKNAWNVVFISFQINQHQRKKDHYHLLHHVHQTFQLRNRDSQGRFFVVNSSTIEFLFKPLKLFNISFLN